MRRTVARRTERSRSDFVCPGDVCKLWSIVFIGDGTVLAHCCVNVAQKWRETSSNGQTNSASRVKCASQLNANEQLSKCPTNVQRTEKSAREPSENGELPNKLKQPAFHRFEENLRH